ncbi:MAG: type II toxin-antitoxin system PemK/MazF family toxin [Spirosomataceae bacterium]
MEVKREEVWLIQLNPTQGSEIAKVRPCLVISPSDINKYLNTVLIAPMTTTIKLYPTRIETVFQDTEGQVAIDQMRAVDKSRLIQKLGKIDSKTFKAVLATIRELFEE